MRYVFGIALVSLALSGCNVATKTPADKPDPSCEQAAECAGRGLEKGPCAGAWACVKEACEWQCSGGVDKGFCETPADCEDKGLSRPGCDGAWTCVASVCGFECAKSNPECTADADCLPGSICVKLEGAETGQCEEQSQCECPASWSPVCGSDGNTWPNPECAACGAVAVAYEGECRFCVPPAGTPSICTDGVEMPLEDADGCPLGLQCVSCACETGQAVCGADGRTYTSVCHADCAGVETVSEGTCPSNCSDDADCPAGSACSAQADCPPDEVCEPTCAPTPECVKDEDCGTAAVACACGAACVAGSCYDLCWECGGAVGCNADADCENAGIPHEECPSGEGSWTCVDGGCAFDCVPEPGTCTSEFNPETGETCTTCVDQEGVATTKCEP